MVGGRGQPETCPAPFFISSVRNNCCDSVATRAVSSDQQLKSLRDERWRPFEAIETASGQKSLGEWPPRPSDAPWWGGGWRFARKFAGAPFQASEGNVLRQRCDARGFTPLRIEIIAKRKVAPAFAATRGRAEEWPQHPSAKLWMPQVQPRCRAARVFNMSLAAII